MHCVAPPSLIVPASVRASGTGRAGVEAQEDGYPGSRGDAAPGLSCEAVAEGFLADAGGWRPDPEVGGGFKAEPGIAGPEITWIPGRI